MKSDKDICNNNRLFFIKSIKINEYASYNSPSSAYFNYFHLCKVYSPIFCLKSTEYCSMLFILLIILHTVFDHDLRDALNYFKHML